MTKKLAVLINPLAGLGGRAGLKGSDGEDIQEQALALGGKAEASARAEQALSLLTEMEAMETEEAKIYKALDKLEALIQHNESDLSTWLPLEYDLQLTYGAENMKFSAYMQQLRQEVDRWTREKIAEANT